MPKLVNRINQRFGNLKVIGRSTKKSNSGEFYWICRCEALNATSGRACNSEISVLGGNLRNGHVKSCGCAPHSGKMLEFPWLISRNALIGKYKIGAKKRNLTFDLSDDECHKLFKGNCNYCGIEPNNTFNNYITKKGNITKLKLNINPEMATYVYNGIDRINNNFGYLKENCLSCCKICNFAKNKMSEMEWLEWTTRLINFQIAPRNNIKMPNFSEMQGLSHMVYKYESNAKRRKLVFELTNEDCFKLFKENCFYCGIEPYNTAERGKKRKRGAVYNGIDRVDPSIGYLKNTEDLIQCVSCCRICNSAKRAMNLNEWKNWINRLINFRRNLSK